MTSPESFTPLSCLTKPSIQQLSQENKIEQRFTKVKTPRTNGKAERVIRTIMEMWHNKTNFKSNAHRKQELIKLFLSQRTVNKANISYTIF